MRTGDRHGPVSRGRSAQTGFTFVWVLAAIAILSALLAAIGPSWADQAKRDRERELLRIGALYASAIAAYRAASPGSLKQYPAQLDDLLADTRMVGTVRYLRKLYADPLDPSRPWGIVSDSAGRIQGVYSLGTDVPLRTEALDLGSTVLPAARRYADWKFIAKVQP